MGMGGQRQAPAALPPEKDPVPIVQEARWAPGPVWTGAENLTPPPGLDSGLSRPYRIATVWTAHVFWLIFVNYSRP